MEFGRTRARQSITLVGEHFLWPVVAADQQIASSALHAASFVWNGQAAASRRSQPMAAWTCARARGGPAERAFGAEAGRAQGALAERRIDKTACPGCRRQRRNTRMP